MPTYDYKCLECGYTFETFHSMSAEPVSECEKCGGEVKRLIGAGAGIIFKGSGFYVNDYKSGKDNEPAKKSDATTPCSCAAGGECPKA
ncbi:MAG: zinc ribbon domain-containing protein [Spirochaetes bacterium]|jgi:putative FmdB family regulatory protein|nr:zinc ribbon domain-containing protein [Spirochaetota bacterium]